MKYFYIILFLLLGMQSFSQRYWETGFWKRFVDKSNIDSSIQVNDYYKNGKLCNSGTIEHGKPIGVWKFYDETGQLIIESEYDGKYIFNDTSGLVSKHSETGSYVNGQRTGEWIRKIYYYEGDSLICTIKTNFDSGETRTINAQGNLISFKKQSAKVLKRKGLFVGGIYIDFGISRYNKDFSQTIAMIRSESECTETINLVGFSFGLAWNIANQLYISYSIDQMYNCEFKNSEQQSMYSIAAASHHLQFGTDFIKNDRFDFCPSLGFYYNDISMSNAKHDELASISNLGLNVESCLRFNVINNKPIVPKGICSFALKTGYQYAFNDNVWKESDRPYPFTQHPNFKNSGLYISLTAGFYIRNIMGI